MTHGETQLSSAQRADACVSGLAASTSSALPRTSLPKNPKCDSAECDLRHALGMEALAQGPSKPGRRARVRGRSNLAVGSKWRAAAAVQDARMGSITSVLAAVSTAAR